MRLTIRPLLARLCFYGILILTAQLLLAACSSESSGGDKFSQPEYPVLPSGKPFDVALEFHSKADCSLRHHWEDFRGEPLTDPATLPLNRKVTVKSAAVDTGYLGLVLTTDCPDLDEQQGFASGKRTMGFIRLPTTMPPLRADGEASPLGMVQANLETPYLGPWIKTLTWHTTSAKWWAFEMEKRRAKGFIELPLINGEGWQSDDNQLVSETFLKALAERAGAFFKAWPEGRYWELGLEENLTDNFHQPHYWENLAEKVNTLRKAADKHAPGTRFIYQIANRNLEAIEKFATSEVAKQFDILALHPYPWPDFPSPDQWLPDFMSDVQTILRRHQLNMPIWFTEIGAPHHGNGPDLFFGYPASGNYVTGLTRYQAVNFLLKMHAVALHNGVEKLFWYNYRDRGIGNEYAENFFGLVDYWGYSKPAHLAYIRMLACLGGHTVGNKLTLERNVIARGFEREGGKTYLLWNSTGDARRVNLEKLPGYDAATSWIGDPVGNTLVAENSRLSVGSEPVWVATGSSVNNCRLTQ